MDSVTHGDLDELRRQLERVEERAAADVNDVRGDVAHLRERLAALEQQVSGIEQRLASIERANLGRMFSETRREQR